MSLKNKLIFKTAVFGIGCCGVLPLSAHRSPYLTRVLEFMPAPGQFMNELPEYEAGDTSEKMRQKAEDYLAYNGKSMVSLGGYGGYIVVGFDHTIANVKGEYDFKVSGNAFYAAANPNPGERPGGSCEPGIIMVSYDANKNGLADDAWYEIAGSEYAKSETLKGYEITYYRPAADKKPVTDPEQPHFSDLTYIRWTDNQGKEGYIPKNVFHSQNYYPEWIKEDRITFKGTRLADNGMDESGTGNYFVLYAYDYGYADNHPNTHELSNIKIDWAVNEKGEPAGLPGIDFIKIYTGVNQCNGWLGECSTEVLNVEDLHPLVETAISAPDAPDMLHTWYDPERSELILDIAKKTDVYIVAATGKTIFRQTDVVGRHTIDLSGYPDGVYFLRTAFSTQKIMKSR